MAEKVLHLAQELLEIITGRGPRPVDANLLWVPDEYFRYGQLSLEEIEEEDKKYILERDSLEQYGGEEAEFDEVSEDDGDGSGTATKASEKIWEDKESFQVHHVNFLVHNFSNEQLDELIRSMLCKYNPRGSHSMYQIIQTRR
ncbi:hypothetical protein COCC4DRAFT_132636 [Bipolaris maydis ATCC 48331]|uniref:Uncharacterized protein n=2 Tax=Cochliobolus heterostrophus TaxID=5016 RepID=M2UZZ7_COCH5|nr:uncharacterized protein COCC4DRAFT_132636 [Bipolaris maydis ATCC 48331]EMD93338.1 hypothetical protein COCHEDRAFT_1212061 [Bipolaris maydis C5]ENI07214.1 hypothetical protein COCC4DRAFT_132636 [Bipolaris maydis ATCC 48331]